MKASNFPLSNHRITRIQSGRSVYMTAELWRVVCPIHVVFSAFIWVFFRRERRARRSFAFAWGI